MVKWEAEYANRGLVVIEITGGEQEPLEAVKRNVLKQKLRHAVLWDQDCRNHRNYGLKNWPVAYLLGADGRVFWEGNPSRVVSRPDQMQALRELLESHLKLVRSEAKEASAVSQFGDACP